MQGRERIVAGRTTQALESRGKRRIREAVGIAVVCVSLGLLIGAADGAATVGSTMLYRSRVFSGTDIAQAMTSWALTASGLGAPVALIIGLTIYYGVFAGRASITDVLQLAAISLIGGVAVCLATGTFLIELSWLATPLITIIAAFALKKRRVALATNGGTQ